MNRSAVLAMLVCAPLHFAGEEKPKLTQVTQVEKLWVPKAEVGHYGPIVRAHRYDGADAAFREYTIEEVTNAKQVVIREESGIGEARRRTRFIIEGTDTSMLVTGREIDLKGYYKVTRVARRGGQALLVLEPESKDERARREADEKARADEARANAEAEKKRQEREKARRAELERKAAAERAANEAAEKPKRDESDAQTLLELAKKAPDAARKKRGLQSLIKQYPNTKAAAEAQKLLDKLP